MGQKKNVGYVIQPFSALLVRLSNDAEITANAVNERTQQLIVLTRWLIVLTVIIIFLTGLACSLLSVVNIFPIYAILH